MTCRPSASVAIVASLLVATPSISRAARRPKAAKRKAPKPTVRAPKIKNSAIQGLHNLVAQSLSGPTPNRLRVSQIASVYKNLNHSAVSRKELRAARWMLSHWRSVTTERLFSALREDGADPAAVAGIFHSIKPRFTPREVEFLAAARENSRAPDSILDLIAEYGAEGDTYEVSRKVLVGSELHLRRLGPPPLKAIRPMQANKWSRKFAWTAKMKNADAYDIKPDGHTVRYRGMTLVTGDYVVGNLRTPEEGLLGSSIEEGVVLNHAGLFAVVKLGGKSFPGVLEMGGKGNRFVPLANFFGPHLYYGEVYRPKNRPDEWHDAVAKQVVAFQNSKIVSYDFQGRSANKDGSFVQARKTPDGREAEPCSTCVGIPESIYRLTGFDFDAPRSTLSKGAQRNIRAFDVPILESFIMASDVVRTEEFSFVGVVDNRVLRQDLARELVMGSPTTKGAGGYPFNHRRLNFKLINNRLQSLWVNVEGALVANDNILARSVKSMMGYQRGEIPVSAPFLFVNFFLSASNTLSPVTLKLVNDPVMDTIPADKPLWLPALELDPTLRARISELVSESGLPGWYEDFEE